MENFKVGDRVRCISDFEGLALHGYEGEICHIESPTRVGVRFDSIISSGHDCNGRCQYGYGRYGKTTCLELINNKNSMSSLKEKFANLFIKEPQKSLRRAGFFDTSDVITDEGAKVYLTHLLTNDIKFQTDVVAPLAVEDDSKK